MRENIRSRSDDNCGEMRYKLDRRKQLVLSTISSLPSECSGFIGSEVAMGALDAPRGVARSQPGGLQSPDFLPQPFAVGSSDSDFLTGAG